MAVKNRELKVGARFGRYECLQRLGQCAFGESWVLRFDSEGKSVLALGRVVRPDPLWDEAFRQAVNEAAWDSMEVLGNHVVHPGDVVFENDTIVLACDYVEGQSLRSLWQLKADAATPLPVAVVLRVVLDALAALDEAHEGGELLGCPTTFGGVAPECLFVGTNGETYVSDALLAGVLATADTARTTGMFYAAPEQATSPANVRSDLFAMGCIAWELLADRELPLQARSATMTPTPTTIPALDEKRRPPGELTKALVQAIAKATTSSPKERFFSPKQMARAIEGCGAKIASREEVASFVESLASARLHSQRKATESSTIADLSKLFGPPRASDRPGAKNTQQPAKADLPSPTRNPLLGRTSAAPGTKTQSNPLPVKGLGLKPLETKKIEATKPHAPLAAKSPIPSASEKSAAPPPVFRGKGQTLLGLNAKDLGLPAVPPPPPPAIAAALPAPLPPVAKAPLPPVAKAPLPPLPELPPAPKGTAISMLDVSASKPPIAKAAASPSDELDEDDLAELREFIGEKISDPDASPAGVAQTDGAQTDGAQTDDGPTRADVRYDDLMGRAAKSVEVVGTQDPSFELGKAAPQPKSALETDSHVWPSATVSAAPTDGARGAAHAPSVATAHDSERSSDGPNAGPYAAALPPGPPRRNAKRYLLHPAVSFFGGSALTLGAVLVSLSLLDSGPDADSDATVSAAAPSSSPPAPEAATSEYEVAASAASAVTEPIEEAPARETEATDEEEGEMAQLEQDEPEAASDDEASEAPVAPAVEQVPPVVKKRHSSKPRSTKSKQFVPSDL